MTSLNPWYRFEYYLSKALFIKGKKYQFLMVRLLDLNNQYKSRDFYLVFDQKR